MHIRSRSALATVLLSALPAAADRPARPPAADPAALVEGAWVIAAVEQKGVVTPQLDSAAERRLNRVWRLVHRRSDRDHVADLPKPEPALPPDTPVYRFGGGRFAVYQDTTRIGWGRYQFGGTARAPVLTLTWEKAPDSFLGGAQFRGLYQFADGRLDWCVDPDKPTRPPERFAADHGNRTVVTFRRIG
jgi:hypothetical protein